MHHLYLGTTNPGKIREFASILSPMNLSLGLLEADIPETGVTFEENARIKARGYAQLRPGDAVFAEDSGLVIPTLNNLPGPWSARFQDLVVGPGNVPLRIEPSGFDRETIDRLNNERVLRMMVAVEQPFRAAYFYVRLVVVRNEDILYEGRGESHGWIAPEMRGTGGFGYDPIFIGQDTFGKTYAELDSVRKNLRSHRKKVIQEFAFWAASAMRKGVL